MSFLTDSVTRIAELETLNLIEIDRPVLSFDTQKKQLIYTFIGRTLENKEYIIELRISITDLYRLERIIVYTPQEKAQLPIIIGPLSITTFAGDEFSMPVITNNKGCEIIETVEPVTECYESFSSSSLYLEMLDKLKAAKDKGCF